MKPAESGPERGGREPDGDRLARELAESEARFRAIVSQATSGVAQTDPDGAYTFVNDRFCGITGYSREELLRMRMQDIAHPEDLPRNLEQLERISAGGDDDNVIEKRYLHKDGSTVWVSNSMAALRDAEGNLQSAVAIVIDITEHKRTEQLLTEQKNLLERIAAGKPLDACLLAICSAISRLGSGVQAGILLAGYERLFPADPLAPSYPRGFSPDFPAAVVEQLGDGICPAAIEEDTPVPCADISRDERISPAVRELLVAQGIRACHAIPLPDSDHASLGCLMLCFERPRTADEWERRLAGFGGHLASIVIERDRAGRFLQQREQQYRSLFNSIDEGFAVVELLYDDSGDALDYRFLETNPAFDKHTGLSGATGRTARSLVPELEEMWVEAFGRIAATGNAERFVGKSASLGRWFDIYGFRVGGRGSRRVALLFRDVSETRCTDERLRRAARLDAFRAALADALRPLEDAEAVQLEATRVLGKYLGANHVFLAEVEPRGTHVIIHRDYAHDAPSVAGRYRMRDFGSMLVERLRSGRIVAVHDVVGEADRFGLGEGELAAFAAVGVRSILAIPLVKRGRLAGFLDVNQTEPRAWSSIDVELAQETAERTWAAFERARAEEALRTNEERLRLTFNAAKIGAWELNLETRDAPVHSPQHDRLFGYEEQTESWSFERLLDHVHPDDREAVVGSFDQALSTRSWSCECRIVRTDKKLRWITIEGAFYDNEAGKPGRAIGIVQDITERKQAEEALKEADRRKDEFLATLAHELRNPLAPIRSGLELMRILGDDRDVINDTRRRMEGQTRHLVRLVDDLLDLSRITSGKVTLRKEVVELAPMVQAACDASRPALEMSGHELLAHLPSEPVYVDADPTRLAQILSNLVTNAAKYSKPDSVISLRAEKKDHELALTVRDRGIGIPPDMLDRIFDMFVQVDYNPGSMQGGLGIGLTLVKRLVEMHGGSIRAWSEGPGLGSEFEVRLPTVVPPEDREDAPEPSEVSRRRLRILVVDDNRDAAELLCAVIDTLGHEVRAAYDGNEAVDAAADFRPDIVLMDLGMPRLNGFDAARKIRQQPWGRRIFLVAVTGWGQEDDVRRTMEAGFDRHLTKPVEPDALRELLEAYQES